MPQCEMCGAEQSSLTTAKIEGAEIDVCDECAQFGTAVQTSSTADGSSKYSTSGSGADSGSGGTSTSNARRSGSNGGSRSRRRDMFDEMDELVQDYDARIRRARESAGLTQEELADQLNEKTSLIRKLERGDVLPSDEVQHKLERKLDISLSGGSTGDADWEGSSGAGNTTLGDVVKRKD